MIGIGPLTADSFTTTPLNPRPGHCGTKYVTAADGTAIAYRMEGEGTFDLVLTNGWSTSHYFWKYLYPLWIQKFRVITWDFRGHGSSEAARNPRGIQMQDMADDLLRVMDAAAVKKGIAVGFSMGNQVVLEACREQPERFQALVCMFGSIERSLSTFTHPKLGPSVVWLIRHAPRSALKLIAHNLHRVMKSPLGFPAGRALGFYSSSAARDDIQLYVDHFGLLDPETAFAMVAAGEEHSMIESLPSIKTPVLIFAGEKDVFAPFHLAGKILHQKLPHSRLILLPHGRHTSLFEHPDEIAQALDDFLAELSLKNVQRHPKEKETEHEAKEGDRIMVRDCGHNAGLRHNELFEPCAGMGENPR